MPPSKSASHRALNLGLLADRPLVIEGLLAAEDTGLFLAALRTCGFAVVEGEGEVALAPPARPPAGGEIACGNAGTMFRFLTAALTAVPGRWRLDGIPRLRQRPVGPLVRALRQLGAEIRCPEGEGHAPLEIRGASLRGGAAVLDAGESSQYLSALLMAAQRAPSEVTVEVTALTSSPYVDLTLEALRAFGGTVEQPSDRVWRVRPTALGRERFKIEGDYSAAAYPAAAAALTGGRVRLVNLRPDSLQGDRAFLDLLARMGAAVIWREDGVEVAGGPLAAVTADLSTMPDQVPTLAALAPFARGVTRIENVPHLRLKESDRLAAMARELGKLGVPVEERPDGLTIPGVWAEAEPPSGEVTIDPHGDHRIAMSAALVGLRRPGVRIAHPEVVAKSYPGFWEDLAGLVGE